MTDCQCWTEVLGRNLGIAGALCRAFDLGGFAEHVIAAAEGRKAWRPGCGKEART